MGSFARLELDPDGDVELILEQPNSQTLQWPPDGASFSSKAVGQSRAEIRNRKLKKKQKKAAEKAAREALEATPTPIVGEASNNPPVGEDALAEQLTVQEHDDQAPVAEGVESSDTIASTLVANNGSEPAANPTSSEVTESSGLRLLVSSSHLRLASSTFRAMLDGPWLEGETGCEGTIRKIRTTEWDAEAFLMVLDIIHGRMLAIPDSIEFELLAKIAVIVDYYNCHEVMEPFVGGWIRKLQSHFPSSFGQECVLWMFISWVFLDVAALNKMTELAIMDCQGSIETAGLPLPHTLLQRIEQTRENLVRKILRRVDSLSNSLCMETNRCPTGCTDMVLGSLIRQRQGARITTYFDSLYVLQNHSVKWLQETLSGFTSLQIPQGFSRYSGFSPLCPCDPLQKRIELCLEESLQSLKTVELEDIWGKRIKDRDARRTELFIARDAWRANHGL